MDLREQQLLVLMLHVSNMNMELLLMISMLGTEVNMSAFRLHLVEPENKARYNMYYRLYSQLDRNFRLFVEDDVDYIDNL